MKKLKATMLLLITTVVLSFPSIAFANEDIKTTNIYPMDGNEFTVMGAGEWDQVNSDYSFSVYDRLWVRPWNYNSWSGTYVTYSYGGDFAVKLIPKQGGIAGPYEVELWEEDEAGNPDEYVGTRTVSSSGGMAIFRGISGYVDGSNGKAEFYVKIRGSNYNPEQIDLIYYD